MNPARYQLRRNLKDWLEALTDKHEVPGVSLAVWKEGSLEKWANGLVCVDADLTIKDDAVFQIGSITKVITTCLVMQLVDEGKIDLEMPVKRYLRDFMIADTEASETITVRQLLNHTSGMAGDLFLQDQGDDGNLIARYVGHCNRLPLIHPSGARYSYSNSAFVTAGRLVEVVRGVSWYQAVDDCVFKPLRMNHALADPNDLFHYRVARGHVWGGKSWILSPKHWLPKGMAPSGSTLTMTASDLILFARAHLEDGKTGSGKSWLSKSSVQAMQNLEMALPQTSQTVHRYAGLGWGLRQYQPEGRVVYGHTGATHGFCSSLQVCPDKNAAFAVLINGVAPAALEAIQADLIKQVFDIDLPAEPAIDHSVTLTPTQRLVAGRYESMDKLIVIQLESDQLVAHLEYKIDPLPPETLKLYPITDQCYACETLEGARRRNWAFVTGDDPASHPVYLFDGSRLNPRFY